MAKKVARKRKKVTKKKAKKKDVMTLWPSKKQWKSWTLPSKLAFIGVYIGIPLTIFLFGLNYLLQPNLEDIVRAVAKESETKLNEQYPIAHTVFGIYQDGFVVPKDEVPSGIEVKWETGRVIHMSSERVRIEAPDITVNTEHSKGVDIHGNIFELAKKIGAKIILYRGRDFSYVIEIIGIDQNLVIVGLGLAPIVGN